MFCCFYNKMSYFYCVLKAISSQDCFPVSCFPFTCPGLCFSFLFLTFLLSSVPTVYSHDRYFTGTVTQCRGSGVSGRLPKHILPPKRPSGGSITAWGTKTLEGRDFCTPKEGTEVTSVWRNSVLLPPGRNLNSVCGSICPFLLWHGVSLSLSLSFSHSLSLSLPSSLPFQTIRRNEFKVWSLHCPYPELSVRDSPPCTSQCIPQLLIVCSLCVPPQL